MIIRAGIVTSVWCMDEDKVLSVMRFQSYNIYILYSM